MYEKSDLIKFLMSEGDKRPNKVIVLGTHGGEFHQDDLLATVVLMHELKPLGYRIHIIRSRNIPYLKENCDIIYDVGHGKYDHHDDDKVLYPNGIKMAACGKILNDVISDSEILDGLRMRLFYAVEASDNGQELPPNMDASKLAFVPSFNPTWGEDRSDKAFYQRFMSVLPIVGNIYERILNMVLWDLEARNYVRDHGELILDNKFMVLDKYCPTFEYAKMHWEFLGSVYPSEDQWTIRFSPSFRRRFETRISAPPSWCGRFSPNKDYPAEDLKNFCPVEGARFCHPAGFLITFDKKEQAIEACKYILEYYEEQETMAN